MSGRVVLSSARRGDVTPDSLAAPFSGLSLVASEQLHLNSQDMRWTR
ncbi:hypothetical protein AFLA70_119g002080 [Aspergillus flavus AF70]|nr:hypothetical protein AFLA70_119g002080 [Aspergillus flavus AF70]